jgi:hypothetical protein
MYNARTSKGIDRTYQAQSREDSGFGTGNNQFNQNPNIGPPNYNSMYNERNSKGSKGFDRTYQALSREGPGFGTGNNQFNHPHHPPFMYPCCPGFNPGMVRF